MSQGHHYKLISLTNTQDNFPLGGLRLDFPKVSVGSRGGNKLALKFSQERAIKEVYQGLEILLTRVLREDKPLRGFPH
jgi:hypothetical protein